MSRHPTILSQITKVVIGMHVLVILMAWIDYKRKPRSKKMKTQQVLQENFKVMPIAKAPKPKKISKTPPKKVAAPKKKMPKIEPMIESPAKPTLKLVLPKAVSELDSEKILPKSIDDNDLNESPYEDYFTQTIQSRLELKEGSFVKVAVTLSKDGDVLKVVHMNSSDVFQRDFIIENLKQMQFASFFGEIAQKSEYTYEIALKGPN